MKRRQIMRGLAAAPLSALARQARADMGGAVTLIVGGPQGAQTSRWGSACALALAAAFPGGPNVLAEPLGGLDGVTGANWLDVQVVPDGKTAAILPGAALIAWLTGDSRVHFNPTRWVPVLAGGCSGVLMVRAAKPGAPSLQSLQAMAPLRLAASQPQSNDLVALLALARLGVPTAPLFGLHSAATKTRAFIAGEVDAVFLSGENVPADMAPLTASGAMPVFSLGVQSPSGAVGPDPLFPGLPDVASFGGPVTPYLGAACQAAAAAARLDFLLVLPKLTDPDAVAQWRQAATLATTSPGLRAAASASWVSLQSPPVLGAALGALKLQPGDQSDLQAFLTKNFGWQPG